MRISRSFFQRWTLRMSFTQQQKGRRLWNSSHVSMSFLPQHKRKSFQSFHSTTLHYYDGKGQDLLEHSSSLTDGTPKIILDSYYPNTGIDVIGLLHHSNEHEHDVNHDKPQLKSILMNSSIMAFPHSCYLWKPKNVKEITLESLSMVPLCKPSIEYLFIGTDTPMPPRELNRIKKGMSQYHIIVDQLDVTNAMGTFNILNGEDRRVAVAILIQVDNASLTNGK